MTRGRKPEWADTELARWLRRQLGGREKQWLSVELQARGLSQAAADGAVNRWTKRGQPKTAAGLQDDSIALIVDVFGVAPPGAAAALGDAAEDVWKEIRDLQRRLDALEAPKPRGGPPVTREGRR